MHHSNIWPFVVVVVAVEFGAQCHFGSARRVNAAKMVETHCDCMAVASSCSVVDDIDNRDWNEAVRALVVR